MRVHLPLVDELLLGDEVAAVRAVVASLDQRLSERCAGARPIWASCDAARAPSRLALGRGRLINVRVVYAVPTSVRLGLHAWPDTVEDVIEDGGVRVALEAHEVEKVVRMATRQAWSALALQAGAEVLAPRGPFADLPNQLLTLISRGAAQTLVDVGAGLCAEGARGDAIRLSLAALRLGRSQLLSLHAPGQFVDADDTVNAERLLKTAQSVVDETELPLKPPGYDAVSAWLAAGRLEESKGAW